MAKQYVIEDQSKSNSYWSWSWYCTDGSAHGFASSRRQARIEARQSCTGEATICPPMVNVTIISGYVSGFESMTIFNTKKEFSAGEISESIFNYVFGYDDIDFECLKKEEIAIAILKIWGVYTKGCTKITILKNHNLSERQFDKLIRKEWSNLVITIDDDGTLFWDFGD